MRRIYKYIVPPPRDGVSTIEMPRRAEPLSVGIQGDEIVLWASVDTEEPMVPHRIGVFATGGYPALERLRTSTRFLGTVQFPGPLVFHVFVAARGGGA